MTATGYRVAAMGVNRSSLLVVGQLENLCHLVGSRPSAWFTVLYVGKSLGEVITLMLVSLSHNFNSDQNKPRTLQARRIGTSFMAPLPVLYGPSSETKPRRLQPTI